MKAMTNQKKCINCGSDSHLLYENMKDRLYDIVGEWNLLRCKSCGLVWLDPIPESDKNAHLYDNYYTHKQTEVFKVVGFKEILVYYLQKFSLLKFIVSLLIELRIVNILSLPSLWSIYLVKNKKSGNLLDIGCGNGSFLALMQEYGWNCFGVEPDEKAAKFARENSNIKVYSGYLEDVNFDESSFDIIRINHVIEHLNNPIKVLNESKRILKTGGKLIIQTPNINSLCHKYIYKRNWLNLDPPRHLLLYNPYNLRKILQLSGFNKVEIRTSTIGARMTFQTSWFLQKYDRLIKDWRNHLSFLLTINTQLFLFCEYVFSIFFSTGEDLEAIAVKE